MIRKSKIRLGCVAALLMVPGTAFGQNMLKNPGFESSVSPKMGNNVGRPAPHWSVSVASKGNVVRVDGPGGYDYGKAGPESDVDGGVGHYFDYAGASGKVYQTFEATCSGSAKVGAWFSTRENGAADGSLSLRKGSGVSGAIIPSSNVSVSLPRGNSKTDPWVKRSATASVKAGQSYTLVIDLKSNNLNVDDAFVTPQCGCEPGTGGSGSQTTNTTPAGKCFKKTIVNKVVVSTDAGAVHGNWGPQHNTNNYKYVVNQLGKDTYQHKKKNRQVGTKCTSKQERVGYRYENDFHSDGRDACVKRTYGCPSGSMVSGSKCARFEATSVQPVTSTQVRGVHGAWLPNHNTNNFTYTVVPGGKDFYDHNKGNRDVATRCTQADRRNGFRYTNDHHPDGRDACVKRVTSCPSGLDYRP